MKRILSYTLSLLCCTGTLAVLTSCGGGSDSNNGTATGDTSIGLAPAKLTGDVTLTTLNTTTGGTITLSSSPARTAIFNDTLNNYTGNYTYKKVGPNMAKLTVTNLRKNAIIVAGDPFWTIEAHITFNTADKVIMEGTETFIDSAPAPTPNGETVHNDPLNFGSVDNGAGGSRIFSLNYEFKMAN